MDDAKLTLLMALKERIGQFGYAAGDADDSALRCALEKAYLYVCNECGTSELPGALRFVCLDMAAGEFLQLKKTFSPGSLAGLDLSAAVKQISEGDTSVTFAAGDRSLTQEQRLDAFIQTLKSYGTPQFACYRRLKW